MASTPATDLRANQVDRFSVLGELASIWQGSIRLCRFDSINLCYGVRIPEAVNTIIRYLETCLNQDGIPDVSLALFGSARYNSMGPVSDLDLIIISSAFEGKSIADRGRLTMSSELKTLRKFMIPMDVINLTPQEYQSMVTRNMFPSKIVDFN